MHCGRLVCDVRDAVKYTDKTFKHKTFLRLFIRFRNVIDFMFIEQFNLKSNLNKMIRNENKIPGNRDK